MVDVYQSRGVETAMSQGNGIEARQVESPGIRPPGKFATKRS